MGKMAKVAVKFKGPWFYLTLIQNTVCVGRGCAMAYLGAVPCKCAPVAPSSQSMLGSLTDQAKTSEVSSWTNAGTGKHLSEAGCYTECACQDLNGLKDPRDELTTVEEDPDPKRNDVGKQV